MAKLTPEELCSRLLEIKAKDAGHQFTFDDLLAIGLEDAKEAYERLVYLGIIEENNDITGSFEFKT